MKLYTSTLAILGLACVIALCLPAQAQETAAFKVCTFSYTPDRDGSPLIIVKFSNTISGRFLIDTGSPYCVISEKLAARIALPLQQALDKDGKPRRRWDGKPLKYILVNGTQVGPLYFSIPFIPVNETMLANPDDLPDAECIDGILGTNILLDYAVLFDFQKHEITMWDGGRLTKEQRETSDMKDAVAMPDLRKNPVADDPYSFFISGQMNEQEQADFVIDTGSDSVIIATESAQKLKLKRAKKQIDHYTTIGKFKFDVSRLNKLSFGSLIFQNQEVEYPHKRMKYDSQLGMNVLSHFRLLLDFPQHMAYFKPVESPANAPKASGKR